MSDNLKEREAFEAWYRRTNDGSRLYCESQWRGWQARAAIEANTPAVPDGWKLVPVELTGKMADAMQRHKWVTWNYRDLLAASPQPQPVAHAPCKGKNCGITSTAMAHSEECYAEHEAIAGAGLLDTPGNRHPEYRYDGYKNRTILPGATEDQRSAYQEGVKAREPQPVAQPVQPPECKNGCPENQVCDFCQGVGGVDKPQPAHCQTCNDTGMLGGPSFYAPDEGGVPCPDCNQPQPVQAQPSVDSSADKRVVQLTIERDFWKEQCAKTEQLMLSWAVDRWFAEVSNRPMVNIHRRTLDDTWRQVIRFACGNPDELIGPSHDDLLAGTQPKPANQQKE